MILYLINKIVIKITDPLIILRQKRVINRER
jgi:hypothetical protein